MGGVGRRIGLAVFLHGRHEDRHENLIHIVVMSGKRDGWRILQNILHALPHGGFNFREILQRLFDERLPLRVNNHGEQHVAVFHHAIGQFFKNVVIVEQNAVFCAIRKVFRQRKAVPLEFAEHQRAFLIVEKPRQRADDAEHDAGKRDGKNLIQADSSQHNRPRSVFALFIDNAGMIEHRLRNGDADNFGGARIDGVVNFFRHGRFQR